MKPSNHLISKKIPGALILALVVFFVLEMALGQSQAVWKLLENYTDRDTDQMLFESRLRNFYLDKENDAKRILIVGGSGPRESVDCEQILGYLTDGNYECKNLGTVAMGPVEIAAHRKLMFASNPDLIIWMINFTDFQGKYHYRGIALYGNMPMLKHYLDHDQWKNIHLFAKYLPKPILGSLSALYRNRMDIQIMLPTILDDFLHGTLRTKRRFRFIDLGRFRDRSNSRREKRLPRNIRRALNKLKQIDATKKAPSVAVEDDFYQDSFLSFISEAKQRSVPLSIMHIPIQRNMYKLRKKTFDYIRDTLEQEEIDYVPLEELPSFKKREFLDRNHLNRFGRKRFSPFVAEHIKNKLSTKDI